uniref:Uncharacterized protein n=1 Tax=Anopheles quadriannulatus TaxID=34691 RepID=A0A182XRM6_ANOQN
MFVVLKALPAVKCTPLFSLCCFAGKRRYHFS